MNRRGPGHRPVGIALAGALVCLFAAASGRATVMVRASVEELTRASAVVALGEVVAVEATGEGPRPGIFTRVELAVEDVWRGPAAEPRVRFWVHGGRVGDRAMRTHGQAVFAPGERVVVFLEAAPGEAGGALFPTGMSQGKWRVDGGRARSCAALGALVERGPDGRLRPTDAPAEAMPLDALRARVEAVR